MQVSVQWVNSTARPSYAANISLSQPLFADASIEDARLHDFHVESFCTTHYHITATYHSGPLTTLTILVATPHHLRVSGSPPPAVRNVLYTPSFPQRSPRPRECAFSPIDAFTSVTTITLRSHQNIFGLLFRVQLHDGSFLQLFDRTEFFVGNGKRRFPYCVEIPLPWPLEQPIQSERVLSLYRSNLFWLQPQIGSSDLNQLLHETNFVLVGLDAERMDHVNGFACIMVTRDPKLALRSTLFSTGTYTAIRVESLCAEIPSVYDLSDVTLCHLSTASDPFSAIRAVIEAHSLQRLTFSSRSWKLSSPKWQALSTNAKILTRLGYCTWDALGHECSQESVLSALNSLREKQIPVSYVVIDDGWQDGGSSGPLSEHDRRDEPSPKLASFHANDKFPCSLRPLSPDGKPIVFVWMTLIGYWGGADGTLTHRDTVCVTLQASIGLQRNQPNDTKMWEREYEIISPTTRHLEDFFIDYFTSLAAEGVRGVKVDGQSILGSLTASDSHLAELAFEYRDALLRAAEQVFPDEAILNSMACAHEIILNSGADLSVANACWRTSDDHSFPGVDETDDMVAWHVLRNAMSSMFLGEIFPVTDWDMFRVSDRNAYMHAVARVLSGGPVYISDSMPFAEEFEHSAFKLVQKLVTYDGRILRCLDPGRPTVDCVFGDPRNGRMFKVFNRNAVSGIVGLFNLSSRGTGHQVREEYCCGDVEDFRRGPQVGFISVVIGAGWRCAFRHDSCFAKQAITLWPMEAAIAHIYPILRFQDGIEIAVVGRLDLLNCGGVVKCVSAWKTREEESTVVDVSLTDHGTFAVWLGDEAVSRLTSVTAFDTPQDIDFMKIDELSFLYVSVPESSVEKERLMRISFGNADASR